jgi:putative Mn2+ efflux pump MntP
MANSKTKSAVAKNTTKDKPKVVSEESKNKKKVNIGGKVVFYVLLFLVLLVAGIVLLKNSLSYDESEVVKYTEKSDIEYKVYLFDNDFYDKEYLEKGDVNLYVANLIKKIELDFKYMFETEAKENLNFTYSIVGKLSITNADGTKSYYKKSYVLLDEKKVSMENKDYQIINEVIDIDYVYYNSLANRFKNSYGIDTVSTLTVYMLVDKTSGVENDIVKDSNNTMNFVIPLSEKAVDISLDYKAINEASTIVKAESVAIGNVVYLGAAIVLVIISLIILIKIMRMLYSTAPKKNNYDKYVNKILREYDRLIAETGTLLSFENKQIITINKFTELLDIHDNLQLPIMYYVITKHQKCYFYIAHNETIYLLTINADDFDKEKAKGD